MANKLCEWDTELSADACEWCPQSGLESLLTVGTYQVDKSENESFTSNQRRGRIYLMSFDPSKEHNKLDLLQSLEFSPLLDMKWNPREGLHDQLCCADAEGKVSLLKLADSMKKLELICSFQASKDGLCLSLDWQLNGSDPTVIVSDSKGMVNVLKCTNNKLVSIVNEKKHDFEAWVSVFDSKSENLFFSGGDDTLFKCTDLRCSSQNVFVNKEHGAGVTSIVSCRQTGLLMTGSYDEFLCLWDTRNMRSPVQKTNLGGGVWKIKQHPTQPEILATACMENGFKILARDKHTLFYHYTDHDSLAYGVDFKKDNPNILASCSFYDHKLSIWKVDKEALDTSSS